MYPCKKVQSRQRSGKGAIRKRFPLKKPRWEKNYFHNITGAIPCMDMFVKPWSHGQIYSTHVCKFCVYANFTHVSKSVHVTAIFPLLHIRKICTWSRTIANLKIYFYLREQNLHTCKSVHVTGKQNLHM